MSHRKERSLAKLLEEWAEGPLREALARLPERSPRFETTGGIALERLYTPLDVESVSYPDDLGLPGAYPFTRGVQPTMYRSRFWTMRQYAGFGDARQTNRRLRYLLAQGQTGLSVAFDLPTQMGYDSDHASAQGEVGRVGVAIDTIDDMQALLGDLPLDRVSTSMTINATAAILLALYVAVARSRDIPLAKLSGTVQNDVLKEYIARGTYIYPPGASLRIATDVFAWCREELPLWNAISVSGYHIREAGSTAVQEVAFTFADGIAYLEAARAAGLPVEEVAGQISFFFNAHNHFLEEIAKFRAARRVWARIMKERFKAKSGRALQMVVPVHVKLALPSERSATVALRTQQILAHESGVADTVDPLGGSYALETLTAGIEERVWAYLGTIDALGGTVKAIETGFQQKEIQEAAFRYQREIDAGTRVIVGVNRFQDEGGEGTAPPIPIQKIDPRLEEEQRARLLAFKQRRTRAAVDAALASVERAAGGAQNLLPHILKAVEARATLGEISDRLRAVFGSYRPASGV
ncbi:MAG: methylmalonyl-CoA mutase [Acidobacteria bacterium]|nr:MAG: methylmalonyl-CoA mutase [Acidobacteriota bacterium]